MKKKKTALTKRKIQKSKKKISKKAISRSKATVSLKKTKAKAKVSPKQAAKSIVSKSQKTDKSKSPGHQKLNFISNFPEHSGTKVQIQDSAVNVMAKDNKMKRANSKNRRIISGATVGNKTGRVVYK